MKCSCCGKILSNEKGESVIALKLTIDAMTDSTPSLFELLRDSLGKYWVEGTMLYEFSFCYECFIRPWLEHRLPF